MNIFKNKKLTLVLLPASCIYRFVVFIRNKLYDWRWLKIRKIHSKVICIGNLTVGGSGKSVIVGYLANILKKRRRKVVILSRGYKRDSSGTVIVTNGKRLLTGSKKAGDEPYFLARRLKTIPVIVDEDRYRGSLSAYLHFKPDYILLDDGFQHRRLYRDWNIVTVNALSAFYNRYLLPAGPFREPLSALKRADFIWVTQFNRAKDWKRTKTIIRKFTDKPFILSNYEPEKLIQIPSERVIPLDFVFDKKILIFSGIANPEGFMTTIRALQPSAIETLEFPDHHEYKDHDFEAIDEKAKSSNVDIIITTEKDFVRLPTDIRLSKPLFYLEIKLKIIEGEKRFWDAILV